MSNLSFFTSADEIRSVLGVSEEELDNLTLALPIYVKTLQFDLAAISSTLEASYLAARANVSRTEQEQRLLDVVQVYSAYATSKTLLTSLPLFAPRSITDGRSKLDRVEDPFAGVKEGVDTMLARLRKLVVAALAALGTEVAAVTPRAYFGVAGLSVNPITNA